MEKGVWEFEGSKQSLCLKVEFKKKLLNFGREVDCDIVGNSE
jgi:hypothetical protein